MDIFAALHRLRIPPNARVPEGIPSRAHIVTGGSLRVAFRTHATQGQVIEMLYHSLIGGNTALVSALRSVSPASALGRPPARAEVRNEYESQDFLSPPLDMTTLPGCVSRKSSWQVV